MGTATQASTRVRRSSGAATPELVRALLPCEIRVVDEERREIEVCATSEAIDAHGTIFGYDASKDAFSRWAGNVREMHERKAVGRKVDVRYDDDARKVYVRVRISAGAQDTWEKVKDGTLDGASIGASNVEWRRQRVSGQDVPVAARYDLVELSLVDSPSNPDAQGVTFVRDGVPDAALLSSLDTVDAVENAPAATTPATPPATSAATPPVIREGAGALTTDDPAAAIAAAALAQGQAAVEQDELRRQGNVAADHSGSEPTANERRLARLGAPGYVARVQGSSVTTQQSSQQATTTRADGVDDGPGAMFDVDGDHDGSGNGAGLEHADELHAHTSHDHPHTGAWDDAHKHAGAHMHADGTSHAHDHAHDHGHHDHTSNRVQERNQAGHSHGHVHSHDHGHYYRVADGRAIDERLVTGEQARTREYISETAFRMAGGNEGQALTAAQYRVAAGVETRLELAAAERAQGAFSRNPLGAADIGTPAAAVEAPTEDAMTASVTGAVRPLDRDGQPTTGGEMDPGHVGDDGRKSGQLDVSVPPEGYAEITDDRRTREADTQRALATAISAAVEAQLTRALAPLTEIEQRLARIEAQPMPGGPVLRSADRTSALTPAGAGSSIEQRIETLQSLAGRIADPQAQVAVAAEMIRLQQEAAGMSPAMQVMPRAGRGWSDGK